MLIVRADTVRDLLLNFTAVEFISQIDNGLFALAKWGYIGEEVRKEATNIASAKLSSDLASNGREIRNRRILRASFLISIFAILLGFWLWIAISQRNGVYLSQTIYVQFGDEFSADLGAFSGLYDLLTTGGGRAEYFARYTGTFDKSSKFGYCMKETAWTFSYGRDPAIVPKACDYRAKSSVSYSFEVASLETQLLSQSLFKKYSDTFLLPEGTECLFTVRDGQGVDGTFFIYYGEDLIAWSKKETSELAEGVEVPFSASPPT
jgi:hypothetical protein